MEQAALQHRKVEVDGVSIHLVEGGKQDAPAAVFLHGWPGDWSAFESVMRLLESDTHVVALDLPGIASQTAPDPGSKRSLATCVHGVIHALGLEPVTLIGQDGGGQVVYAYVHAFPDELRQAVIMSVAVPAVEPWDAQDHFACRGNAVQTPVLYLQGKNESDELERHVEGLRAGGLRDVQCASIPNSEHFAADEHPAEVAAALRAFIHPEVAKRGWHTA